MKKILFVLAITFFLAGCTPPNNQIKKAPSAVDKNHSVNEVKIPRNCVSWFDGCNTCGVKDGKLTMCTQMACEKLAPPKCLKFADENPAKLCHEGDRQQCITNSDGKKDCIADAIYVCRNGKWKIEGSMPPRIEEKMCTMEYAPVCGTPYFCLISKFAPGKIPVECTDGKTYSNKCFLEADKAIYKYDGECKISRDLPTTKPPVKPCTKEYRPVCGGFDTGIRCIKAPCPSFKEKTYANICLLKKDGAEFLHDGECREEVPEDTDQPPLNCTSWFDGCNTCGVINGKLTMCTQMACEAYQLPKCLEFK